MPHTKQQNNNLQHPTIHHHSAFTLVELIVVIVILAILATIAFLSFSSQSGSARDSTRLSDIASIKKGIEMYNVGSGLYPSPDEPLSTITYSGGAVWTQGVLGDKAYRLISKTLSKKVTDPLKGNEYDYSLASNKREYQVAGNFENPTSLDRDYMNPFISLAETPKSFALGGTGSNVYISGNYNGVLLKVFTGSTYYYLPTPTLFGLKAADQQNIAFSPSFNSGTIILPGTKNYASYKADQIYATGGDNLSAADINALMAKLQTAYSGSNITTPAVQQIASADSATLASIGNGLAKNVLGGGNFGSAVQIDYIPQWKDIPGTSCANDDFVFTSGAITYRWGGCNSNLGTGIQYSVDQNCYNYQGGASTGCNRTSTENENLWNPIYGIDNIWGKLYNWSQATQANNACPNGWHLPSDQEWTYLELRLAPACTDINSENIYRCNANTLGWSGSSTQSSSNNMVKALKIPLSGYSTNGTVFTNRGYNTGFWTASISGSLAYDRFLNWNQHGVFKNLGDKAWSFSVRCLKDY